MSDDADAGGEDPFDRVVAGVRERVLPDDAERAEMERAATEVVERAEAAVADLDVEADVVRVGSTARGTWLSGDRDLDVFVRFPPDIERAELERYGLEVGHTVLPDGHEEYAEHPYVKGEVDGFDVDLVPCYRLDDATAIRSAVDRTPFHTQYLRERLDGALAAEVVVAKAFLKGIGAYGSDLRTKGFSGYLTELLVLEYGGFRALCEAAADEWHPPVELDPSCHGRASFDDPLVVIDPTDPERNVAAVCSAEAVGRLIHYARDLLADPRAAPFEPRDLEPLDAAAVRDAVADRGTHPVAIRFRAPDVVDDQLYPQLDRSLAGLRDELERRGFEPVRADRFAQDAATSDAAGEGDGEPVAALLVECAVAELPAVERHGGPPVAVRQHAEGFYGKYADDETVYGPFLDGDRYVVERPRDVRTPAGLAETELFDCSLGPHVESSLEDGYDVLAGAAVAELAEPFGAELAAYFDPVP
ncbi:CCA tRNA nucleotidyltransferase [Haloglomus litoreum]|uniref:CCA tRNA nucleotidyltransferase n=1 Tax=Haloglomus litoreum TaxID=3034026 RepID=UPI0023E76EE1|nr:CCA tRNA nucleotidyltransferase [Haloglomus sp. DT116]